MADNQENRKPLPQNAFNEYKTRLFAEPKSGGRAPSLAVAVIKNQPRITVFTGVEGDRNKGVIHAAMDVHAFYDVINMIERMIDADVDSIEKVINNTGWNKEFKYASTTVVGKDSQGRVFISVIDERNKGITPIKFVFKPTNYHYLADKEGNGLTEADVSKRYAKAYVDFLRGVLPAVLATQFEEYVPKSKNNSGGGNWKNKGGGNDWKNKNNNYKKQESPKNDFDPDGDIVVDDGWSF